MTSKRKLGDMQTSAIDVEDAVDPSDELQFVCLGGGNEVGRSCHIIQYKGKTVMLDAGMHPAFEGLQALPFYDEFDLSQVDVLLISHFHVDHAASLPYVLAKTPFRGRVFMTHPTKAIYKWLIQDSVRVGNLTSSAESKNTLYTEQDHLNTFPRIEAIDFYTTHNIAGIRVTPYPAGHVLGAAMYLIEIAGLKVLFTGDYSREDDRHLVSASVPKNIQIDLLICESTFGTGLHTPRIEREAELMKAITGILDRGGRVLMPVFALGTAQELLLILDEYWEKHPKYQKVPIYYASNLARKCMAVYQTYISAMNDNIKRMFRERMAEAEKNGDVTKAGPWDFRYVRALKSLERFEDLGTCVMLANPGMMQNGASRELLERWAPDQRNGVVITGYSVEGTMAQMMLNEPEFINAVMTRGNSAARRNPTASNQEQQQIPRRCSVQEISFAAHVDGQQNREFVEEVNAPVVILVHGARHNMTRFKSKLLSLNASRPNNPIRVYTPANCDELRIPFDKPKFAKVVGRLARDYHPPQPGDAPTVISGVMVRNEDHQMSFMAPEDLPEYAGLPITTITERLHLNLGIGPELIRYGLSGYFGHIDEVPNESAPSGSRVANGSAKQNGEKSANTGASTQSHPTIEDKGQITTFIIMDTVLVYVKPGGLIELVWEGNAMNDTIGDAVIAGLTGIAMTPAGVKFSEANRAAHDTHQPSIIEPEPSDDEDVEDTVSEKPFLDDADEDDSNLETAILKRFVHHKHPYADWSPEEVLERFCWFLEAQFGEGLWSPILIPRRFYDESSMGSLAREKLGLSDDEAAASDEGAVKAEENGAAATPLDLADLAAAVPSLSALPALPLTPAEREALKDPAVHAELERLNKLGILIPGFELRLDKQVARLWCEDLDVECASQVWKQRIVAVVRNAARVLKPLGQRRGGGEEGGRWLVG